MRTLVLATLVAALACGDAPSHATIEQAVTVENTQAKAAAELEAAQAKRRQEDAEERRRRKAAIDAAIDAAAVMPATVPTDLDAACDAVVDAYDAYMKNGPESDALRWSDGRRRKMGERRSACITVGKIGVVACEAHALRNAPALLDELSRRTAARRLMERCHEKFGES